MKRSVVIFALMLLTLAACDTVNGLHSSATVSKPLDSVCISGALASVPGIVVTKQGDSSIDSQEPLPDPGLVRTRSTVWVYTFGGVHPAILQTNFDNRGRGLYSNGLRRLNARVPLQELRAFEPVMYRVNAAIEARCGLTSDLTIFRR